LVVCLCPSSVHVVATFLTLFLCLKITHLSVRRIDFVSVTTFILILFLVSCHIRVLALYRVVVNGNRFPYTSTETSFLTYEL
jgi:hypothetical protein